MSAFEMFDNTAYKAVKKHGEAKKVFEKEGNFYCLIETGGSSAEHDSEVRPCRYLLEYMGIHLIVETHEPF